MYSFRFRIKKRKEFEEVFKKGKSFNNSFYLLKVKENDLSFSRFAFVAPVKSFKKSSERNKIKRKLKEAVRSVFSSIDKGFDFIFIIKKEAKKANYSEIKEQVIDIVNKTKKLQN